MNTVIIIPVRLNSRRLPNKALIDIGGKSLIHRVVDQSLQTKLDVYVVTDSREITTHLMSNCPDVNVLHQQVKAESGTERISHIIDIIEADNIINVQGDQPFIAPAAILEMKDYMESNPLYPLVTPIKYKSKDECNDSSKCKVVVNLKGKAVYFSRSPIPYNAETYWGHCGMYGYKKSILQDFRKLKDSPLERAESLEQLRFIDNDISIQTYETQHSIFSVDTEIDLIDAIEYATKVP